MARGSLPRLALMCFVFALGSAAHAQELEEATQRAQRIEGSVTDQSSAPVAGARVSLLAGQTVTAQTRTDAVGHFVLLLNPRAEAVRLVIEAEGFARYEHRWREPVPGDVRLEIKLTLPAFAERVSITATRTETRLNETAASVTAVSGEELDATGAQTIDDSLRQVAGFQLFRRTGSRAANPTAQGVSLRGVGASGASRALVFADGLPLNDPFGGWVYWGRVARASVQSMEVLRGGASHLYGSGALGGVINIFTRRPIAAKLLRLDASYGQQDTHQASLYTSASARGWGASLAAESFGTRGYVIVPEGERGAVDVPANVRYQTLNVRLERELGSGFNGFLQGSYFKEARSNGTPLQTNGTRIRQLSLGFDIKSQKLGALYARAYLGAQVFDQNFSAVSLDRRGESLTRIQRVPAQSTGLMLQWTRTFGARQTFVAGLDAREVRGASDELGFVQGAPSAFNGAGGRERTFGVFVEDIVRIGPDLFITGGVRFDRWRNYDAFSGTRPVRQPQQASLIQLPDRTEAAFSPYLSALYRVNRWLNLSAGGYRAFRQPTLNELYRSFRVGDVLTLANENLRAERLTGGEAGAYITLADNRLNVRATYFYALVTRPVANVTLNASPNLITRRRQNLGRTRSAGLELEAGARLSEHWSVSFGYLFADARVMRFPAQTALEGLMLPQVARHQLTFQTELKARRNRFALQGRLSGQQFDDDQNLFRLAPFFTLDAYASRSLARSLELFVAAENVFNRRAEVGRTPVLTVGPPVTLRAGFKVRLGAP